MPLIVKLKRPGAGTSAGLSIGSAAQEPPQRRSDAPVTPTNEHQPPLTNPAPQSGTALATPALAAEVRQDELAALSYGTTAPDGREGAHEVAMAEAGAQLGDAVAIKVESGPRTPDLSRAEDLKSPVDTAMRDSTPITEKGPQPPFTLQSSAAARARVMPPAAVDVLIAPSCLQHRYVRSHDLSAIVERPERLRAVILGIAAAIARAQTTNLVPAARSGWGEAEVQAGPSAGDDELAHKLQAMNLDRAAQAAAAIHVWLSNRSLELNPPDPAVAFVHSHPEEGVQATIPEYAVSQGLRLDGCVPTDGGAAQTFPGHPTIAPLTDTSTREVSFASYLAELCRAAPAYPPDRAHEDPDRTLPGPHPSEVPVDMPQGDLYLRGPSTVPARPANLAEDRLKEEDAVNGGSGEAIRHALGACAEAVDRVVLASRQAGPPDAISALDNASPHLAWLRLPAEAAVRSGPNTSAAEDVQPGPSKRNFVLTRPPGHHCSGNQPAGFCWASNAAVAAAHAYIRHGIDRVVILDIDLHHGNGTQALAWRINAETLQADAEREAKIAEQQRALLQAHTSPKASRAGHASRKSLHPQAGTDGAPAPVKQESPEQLASSPFPAAPSDEAKSAAAAASATTGVPPRGLKIFYGSLHDIESYPCETGDPALVRDASTCIDGAHGQWIWNVHLNSYASEADFHALYTTKYAALFDRARAFASATAADPSRTLVLVSAGFDACAHEYSSMSRHGRSVPVSFYARFARDAVGLAEEIARGMCVSVLEGGYSDRALCSAALGYLSGLAGYGGGDGLASAGGECADWWDVEALLKLEKGAKKVAAAGSWQGSGNGGSATSSPANARKTRGGAGTGVGYGSGAPTASNPAWLQGAMAAFALMEEQAGLRSERYGMAAGDAASSSSGGGAAGSTGRVLRDRTRGGRAVSGAVDGSSPARTGVAGQ